MSVRSMSPIEHSGTRPIEQALLTGAPSSDAVRTRKRGCGGLPCSEFHNSPVDWNTSTGATAVDAYPPSSRTTVTSSTRSWPFARALAVVSGCFVAASFLAMSLALRRIDRLPQADLRAHGIHYERNPRHAGND